MWPDNKSKNMKVQYKERKKRSLQEIINPEKIQEMIPKYMVNREFYVKHSSEIAPVQVITFDDPDIIFVKTEYQFTDSAVFYRMFNKYLDISCTVEEKTDDLTYRLSVKKISIATEERKSLRKPVNPGDILINNIRIAKNVINASLFNIPTSVKVHFGQNEQKLSHLADIVRVKVFDKKDDKLEIVRKSCKSLWIPDTNEISSYFSSDENEFINYHNLVKTDIQRVIDQYQMDGIISEVIVPILYVGHDGLSIPLGYIQLLSKTKKFDLDTILELKALGFEIVDTIRNANTTLMNIKQEVLNVSSGGLKILVSDQDLKEYVAHQKGFGFDIVFKMQAPITVFSEIIYTYNDPSNNLIVGVEIGGYSTRRKHEGKRLVDLIKLI